MRLIIIVLAALLTLVVLGMASTWSRVDWHMSIHGWIALLLGVVISLALGGGLMALSFFSARKGYDERARTDLMDSDEAPPGEDH